MENLNPLVSIIIPVYNGSNYLKEAIDSALSQTYINTEIIVVNDGSADNGATEKIALSYGDKIKYLKKENGGVATALNLAIKEAKGEYISWLSHDDLYLPEKLEQQLLFLKNSPCSSKTIIFSDYILINTYSNSECAVRLPKQAEELLIDNLKKLFSSAIHGCSLLLPSEAFKNRRLFNEELRTTQDYDLWFKLLKEEYRFIHIPQPLIKGRIHEAQDTNSKKLKVIQEREQLFTNATILFFDELRSLSDKDFNFFLAALRGIDNNKAAYCLSLCRKQDKTNVSEYKEILKNHINNLQIGDNDLKGNKFNGHDLHYYLSEKNIRSHHLVLSKLSKDPNTFSIFSDNKKRILQKKMAELESTYDTHCALHPFALDIIYNRLFHEADIVHYHLIHNYFFNINFLPIMSRMKPSVWTLHDPWALSGHCIHSFGCEKWQTGCGDCPNLDSPFKMSKDNTALNFELKRMAIQNSKISVIAASAWMMEKIKKSPITKDLPQYLVPFGVNQTVFKPRASNLARKELGIEENSPVIMFRADENPYKGLELIKKALTKLNSEKKTTLLAVGSHCKSLTEFAKKFNVKEYEWISDDNLLASLYQACDIFLMPSQQESFGMMAIEAMSCGKTVLATKGTALPDTINAPGCGVAVENNDSIYTMELQRLMDNPQELQYRGEKSLKFAQSQYNHEVYTSRIIDVYKDVISRHHLDTESKHILEQLQKHMQTDPFDWAYPANRESGGPFHKLIAKNLGRAAEKLKYNMELYGPGQIISTVINNTRKHGLSDTIKKIIRQIRD